MTKKKAICGVCGRQVGVLSGGNLARHKTRKGSKDHARCEGGKA